MLAFFSDQDVPHFKRDSGFDSPWDHQIIKGPTERVLAFFIDQDVPLFKRDTGVRLPLGSPEKKRADRDDVGLL